MEEVKYPKVIKRDGREVVFNEEKIKQAISAAMKKTEGGVDTDLINRIVTNLKNSKIFKEEKLEVEQIQDFIENELMKSSRKEVAKEYILYREERSKIRRYKSKLMKTVASKLNAKDIVNQNANVDENSFGGRAGEALSVVMKQLALDTCMSKMSRENHLNNEIYIHDLDSYKNGLHNCCLNSTKFITDKGVVDFTMLKEGEKVNVVDRNGEWREATVRKYGKQKMYELTFDCGHKTKKTVICTRNHRWILKDGTVTDNIQVGDELIQTPEIKSNFELDNFYWSLGFTIGDGCDVKNRTRDKYTSMKVRLCGDKIKYLDRFLSCGWVVNEYFDNGDRTVSYKRGSANSAFKNSLLNTELWRILPSNALYSLFDGYISADGHFNKNGSVDITTSDDRTKLLIETIAPIAGYHVWSERTIKNSTNFKENRTLYCYHLVKKQSPSPYFCWKLVSIKSYGERDAWCVEEPVTHSFTLQGCMVTGNCLSCPLDDLLAKGFTTRQTDIRPAGSINTAFQLVAVIFQIQSLQQFGGVSATHLDHTMVPYVRKSFYKHYKDGMTFIEEKEISSDLNDTLSIEDGKYKENDKVYKYALSMTEKELKQATEGLYHNLNSLQSRSGCQLPFSSLNYGTCTLPEGRMVIKALLEGSIDGVGKFHRTSVFPCGIFQYMKGVNDKPGTPNYDMYRLALKSTAQRLYPNYANVDWSGNAGYDRNDPKTYFSTMGCRTANGFDINAEPGQNPQLKDGRGNICPVTIILPTLAMEADRDVEKFMSLLDTKLSEAKDMLIERFNRICSQSPKAASFMYDNRTMFGYHPEEGIKSALKHGTLAVGQLGLAETLQLLIGTDHTTEKGMELAKRIENLFKTRVAEFKQKYKLNFGVYYTPAENLCHTALNKFKEKYGVIPNVSDKEFFTNSMHVPVWREMDPFQKIDIESQLTGYSSAGCITYVECPSTSKHNIDALEELVNYAMDHDIPYFAINVPNDTCNNCGYTDEMPDVCPQCGSSDIKRLRRVTGYLSNDYKTSFNKGKQDEVEHRVQHFTH